MAGGLLPLIAGASSNYTGEENPWGLSEASQRHREVPSTDILELWAAVMKGHQSQDAGLGTTGEAQRWGGKVCFVDNTPGIRAVYKHH